MLDPLTQNPFLRALDILGRDFASHPPEPMPPVMGPRMGLPRSAEAIALEKGFNSLSDMRCRIAEADLGSLSDAAALREWFYADGSKGGLLALINAQYEFFGPETTAEPA